MRRHSRLAPCGRTVRRGAGLASSNKLLSIAAVTLAFGAIIVFAIVGRVAPIRAQESQVRIPLVTDWTHRHMIYSAPSSLPEAFRLQNEQRYILQWLRRRAGNSLPGEPQRDGFLDGFHGHHDEPESTLRPDWGFSLPGRLVASAALDAVYPAKYSFNITAAPSCAKDFLVVPTGVLGSATTIAASATGSFSAQPTSGAVTTITRGVNTLTVTAGAGINPYAIGGTTTVTATNLSNVIVANGGLVGVTATHAGPTVTITATTAGSAGNSITLSTAAVSNFTWGGSTSSSLQGGADGTASIAAVNNLYAGANGACTGPTAYWNYNTGGTVVTSPVLSGDGSQVAFVQTTAGVANLVVLKWSALATFAPLASNGAYPTCAAPCMIALPFSGAPNDTGSSPFYVYGGPLMDTLYVGDNSGKLHKFNHIFNGGTPAEVGGPWPLTVSAAATPDLTGAVYDSGSGNIFLGDASGNLWYVRETGSSATIGGTCGAGTPPCLGSTHLALGGAITDGPIVDGTNETVFAFDGTTNGSITAPATSSTGMVVQSDTALTLLNGPNGTTFANSAAGAAEPPMHDGDFDNTYYSAAKGSGTGKLYVCAQTPAGRDYQGLFRISFAAVSHGAWGTISVLRNAADPGAPLNYFQFTVNTSGGSCSPLTEIHNSNATPATDWLFLSVGNHSAGPGTTAGTCGVIAAGCILSVNLTTVEGNTWPPTSFTVPAGWINGVPTLAGPLYANGRNAPPTSGFVLDNIVSTSGVGNAQYSNIYFLWLSNATNPAAATTYTRCNGSVSSGGCNVKLTQSGLN